MVAPLKWKTFLAKIHRTCCTWSSLYGKSYLLLLSLLLEPLENMKSIFLRMKRVNLYYYFGNSIYQCPWFCKTSVKFPNGWEAANTMRVFKICWLSSHKIYILIKIPEKFTKEKRLDTLLCWFIYDTVFWQLCHLLYWFKQTKLFSNESCKYVRKIKHEHGYNTNHCLDCNMIYDM